jgi:hypothetical protein
MSRLLQSVRQIVPAVFLLAALRGGATLALPAHDKPAPPAIRWNEQQTGCTFSHSDDGKLQYGMWVDNVGITLAVDSQELEKVRRRHEKFLAVFLDIRYRAGKVVDFDTRKISLEFLKHFHTLQPALDPDEFVKRVQQDADAVDDEAARDIKKHPEHKTEKETYAGAFQKDAAELIEFVSKDSLRPARLDSGNPQVSGWVLFSTDNKWITLWKSQEDFLLRVPIEGKIFEFPFTMPPAAGNTMLRRRS